MNFTEISNARESARSYEDKIVSREDLEAIISETILAPSACNAQPWKFVVCDGETAKKIPNCLKTGLPINQWTDEAPAFIVVCETKAKLMSMLELDSQFYAQMDVGIATATICYSATDKGLSTCIIGSFNQDALKELLNIPDDINIRLVISVGYASSDLREKRRKNIDEIRSYNTF